MTNVNMVRDLDLKTHVNIPLNVDYLIYGGRYNC